MLDLQPSLTPRHCATTLLGRPIVAIRDGDDVRVVANVCAHRGSLSVEDADAPSSTLVCPYHRWAYRLDGTLIGAPLSEAEDMAACARVQRGLQSGLLQRLRLIPLEATIAHFQRWVTAHSG